MTTITPGTNTGRICPRGASYYEWRAGDTVASVARANGITTQTLRLFNDDVDFAQIAQGDIICIPPRQLSCVSGQLYQVRIGDTYDRIAALFGISTVELRERNPDVSPESLVAGQYLCVPSATSSGGTGGTGGGTGGSGGANTCPPNCASCASGTTGRTVRSGQTFTDLLIENDVSYSAMRSANPSLQPALLVAGQLYCVPPAGTRRLCQANARGSYIITGNRTLGEIASQFSVTQGQLLQANPMLAPSDFIAGRTICIP